MNAVLTNLARFSNNLINGCFHRLITVDIDLDSLDEWAHISNTFKISYACKYSVSLDIDLILSRVHSRSRPLCILESKSLSYA